jgi:endonuclease/exonuclease/phosphatase family metal-dependent hydrolase
LLAIGVCRCGGTEGAAGATEPIAITQDMPRPDPFAIRRVEQPTPSASSHPGVLRLVQWNVKSGRDSSIEAIAARLAALDGDVITLQEIDSNTRRTGRVDQPSFLGQALGLNYIFAPTIPWSDGIYGIVTLSRYPFTKVDRIALSNEGVIEPRTALDVTLQLAAASLRIVNHHADTVAAAAIKSTHEVLQQLQSSVGSGVAFAGDLNQLPTDPGPRACVEAGLVDLGHEPTDGARRIDYVFLDNALARCVMSMKVEPASESDHNPLIMDLDLDCLQKPAPIQ